MIISDYRESQRLKNVDIAEYLHNLDAENKYGLRPLSQSEQSNILGISRSSNEVLTAANGEGRLLLVKQFKSEEFHGRPAPVRAHTELVTLSYLNMLNQDHFPKALCEDVLYDTNGQPVLLIEYLPSFTSFTESSDRIQQELLGEESPIIIPEMFQVLRLMHDNNIAHLDLKGDNVGMVSPGKTIYIDFESANLGPKCTSKNKLSDLARIAQICLFSLKTEIEDLPQDAVSHLFQLIDQEYGNTPEASDLRKAIHPRL